MQHNVMKHNVIRRTKFRTFIKKATTGLIVLALTLYDPHTFYIAAADKSIDVTTTGNLFLAGIL